MTGGEPLSWHRHKVTLGPSVTHWDDKKRATWTTS